MDLEKSNPVEIHLTKHVSKETLRRSSAFSAPSWIIYTLHANAQMAFEADCKTFLLEEMSFFWIFEIMKILQIVEIKFLTSVVC